MELIFETNSQNEINEMKLHLESNGIPVFVGNENTARNFQHLGADAKLTLWVFLKEQYEEALVLLKDPEYEVSNQVDVKEFYKNLKINNNRVNEKFYNRIMLVIVLGVVAAFTAYAYFKIAI
jgi:hypothetical protein